MPFKTKRQKIAAQQKRYSFTNGRVSFVGAPQSPTASSSHAFDFAGVDTESLQNKALKPEIFKIGLISLLIIGLQITLRMLPSGAGLGILH